MTIKKLVVGSMFSMLLVSEMAAADWGDVYYCQMTNFNRISIEGETLKEHKLEKFKFKLDPTKNAMVFGNTGHFQDKVFELTTPNAWVSQSTILYASSLDSSTYFENGKFLFASVYQPLTVTLGIELDDFGITSVSADCDKF